MIHSRLLQFSENAKLYKFSIFMDRRELADQCEEMVNIYLHGEDDPEVNDYEQYDNGIKIGFPYSRTTWVFLIFGK